MNNYQCPACAWDVRGAWNKPEAQEDHDTERPWCNGSVRYWDANHS